MKSTNVARPSDRLPAARDLTLVYGLSLAAALVMAVASAAGVLYPASLYPTEELRRAFVSNDVVNLVIGLPILLASMVLARRGRLIGLLLWPGALFYVVYNAIAYAFGLPLTAGLVLALLLLALSVYATIGLVASIDGSIVQRRLQGTVPEKLAGGVLFGLGSAFLLRTIGVLIQALLGQASVSEADLAVLASDFLTAPASIVGGVLLWRRKALGYVAGAGLLFQVSMLFAGLIAFLLLQPLMTNAPFLLADTLIVSVMALIAFVPAGLFVRGVVTGDRK